MKRVIKYIAASAAALIFILCAAVFLMPSIVLNRANLLRLIKSLDGSAAVSFAEMDISVVSRSIFDKEIRFSAKDLCIKNQMLNMCLPNAEADITLTVRPYKFSVSRIDRLAASGGRVTLDIPVFYRELVAGNAPASRTEGQKNAAPNIKLSLILRGMELFAGLQRKDMQNIKFKNMIYDVRFKDAAFKGAIDLEDGPDAIKLGIENRFRGMSLGVSVKFGENSTVSISLDNEPVADIGTTENIFTEPVAYIGNKEIYRYLQKSLRAKLNIRDVGKILKIADLYLYSNYAAAPVSGPLECDITLNLNSPDIDDTSLDIVISGQLLDSGSKLDFDGELRYDFYQKIPTARIAKLGASSRASIENYASYKFLSYLAQRIDLQAGYYWKDGKPEVVIRKDYSRIPKRAY